MRMCTVVTFDDWRHASRRLLAASIPPHDVHFRVADSQRGLFDDATSETSDDARAAAVTKFRVGRSFLEAAKVVACHRDAGRFGLLYRLLWRLTHGEPELLNVATDDDVHRLRAMEKAVRRDAHKMKAFVRFRRVVAVDHEQFIAWHQPDHKIVRLVAPFFARRFPAMHWSILTPDESVSWDTKALSFGPGVPSAHAPRADELEDLWRTYYASIFNPARVKLKAMKREMPVRHWNTLPETTLIPELLAEASQRVTTMIDLPPEVRRSAADYFPSELTYEALRHAASQCQGCELHCHATQAVFGEGPTSAQLMLVGEQPGDMEDVQGRPFVGPAGEILEDAMRRAGIERERVYLTNTVKHFKFIQRGKRRIHSKPGSREIIACRPWLEAEIELVRPKVLVCLGATAAQALIGADFRILRQRGQFFDTPWSESTIATYHPSAVLRAVDPAHKSQIMHDLFADLSLAVSRLSLGAGAVGGRRH